MLISSRAQHPSVLVLLFVFVLLLFFVCVYTIFSVLFHIIKRMRRWDTLKEENSLDEGMKSRLWDSSFYSSSVLHFYILPFRHVHVLAHGHRTVGRFKLLNFLSLSFTQSLCEIRTWWSTYIASFVWREDKELICMVIWLCSIILKELQD